MRQRDFDMELCVNVNLCGNGEGGVTMYMCENEHYDIALKKTADGAFAILKLNIGGIKHEQNRVAVNADNATLIVRADHYNYNFICEMRRHRNTSRKRSGEISDKRGFGRFHGYNDRIIRCRRYGTVHRFSCAYTESEE